MEEKEISSQTDRLLEKHESEWRMRKYAGKMAVIVASLAVVWSLFQLFASSIGSLDAMRLRAWHLLFLLTFVFLLYPARRQQPRQAVVRPSPWDIICIACTVAAYGYFLLQYEAIAMRGYLNAVDYLFGGLGILVQVPMKRVP